MAIPKRKNIDTTGIFKYDEASDSFIAWTGDVTTDGLTDDELRASPVEVTESVVVDTPEFFSDASFVTGDSPVTLDLNAALGRNATTVTIINDGAGEFTVAYSTDGASFGDAITVKYPERLTLKKVSIDSVKITWVSDSAYRVIAI